MKKAVIYARFSSHKQQETSIEGQIKVCEDYANREGIEIIDTYIDRAISGTTDKRPSFNRMILDSENGDFDYIIVYKLDRFARNRLDSALYKQMLNKNGVKLKSAMEPISEAPEGILLEGMLESYNEYYSKELSQKTRRGMKINAEKANSNGGTIPYGFKVENKKLVIDKESAEIVKEIFKMYSEGNSKSKIINSFENRSLPRGKKISLGVLSNMLSNKKYIGIYHFNGIEVEGGCPAIIEKNLWNKVQKLVEQNKKSIGSKKTVVNYYLRNKIFCGECGDSMQGESIRKYNGKMHYYYVCKNRKHNNGCSKKRENKEYIESFVIDSTLEYILNAENSNDIIAQIMLAVDCNTDKEKIKSIKIKINSLDAKIANNLDAICETDNKTLREKILSKTEKLEEEKAELEKLLAKIKKIRSNDISPEKLRNWILSYKQLNPADPEHCKNIINTFIHSVYVYDDKIAIYYNFNSGLPIDTKTSRANSLPSLSIGSPSWT